MKFFFYLIASLFALNISAQTPIITSFSPTAGLVGSNVIISGSNFSTTASNNIVFFGAVKATVVLATTTSLTVSVPPGASYQPITVTVNGLTAYSTIPFVVTFTGGGNINSTSFENKFDVTTDLHPNGIALTDLDGDGRTDIATPNNYSITGQPASISVLRNTSTGGTISFAPKMDINTGVATYAIASGDLDGDGKPDLVSNSIADLTISIFRNTSTPGTVAFAPKVDYATISGVHGIAVGDIDGDGKPDIAVVNYLSLTMSVYRNTSTPGFISFAPKVDFATAIGPENIVIGDMDGDGKPDIAVSNSLSNSFSTFKNNSTPGNISLGARADIACGSGNDPSGLLLADLDGDNKLDLTVVIYNNSFAISAAQIFKNISTSGSLAFSYSTSVAGGTSNAYHIAAGDVNGDGKPDLAFALTGPNYTKVFQNNSTPGGFSFTESGQFSSFSPYAVQLTDLNNDSKPDLIASFFTSTQLSVFKSRCGLPGIGSFSPAVAVAGTSVTISGYNLTGITGVTFGAVPAASFSVVNSNTITAVVGTGASGNVAVTGPLGSDSMSGFSFIAPPTITSFTPLSGGSGATITITGTSFIGVNAVSIGGINAASFTVQNSTTITATLGTGASGSIVVTTMAGSASLGGFTYLVPTITSFTPTIGVNGTVVTITGTNLTGASSVSFGGVSATQFNVVNATTITATVGIGASGNVVVVTPIGTATSPGFVYTAPIITSFTPVSGNNGTTVTITGINFTGATDVSFGGTAAASFIVVNANTITAVASSGTSGSVSVTTPFGTSTLNGFIYTGPPVITSFTPMSAGPGTVITISGAHFTGATGVSFGGTSAYSFLVINNTTITAIVGSGASGTLSVTTNNGSVQLPGFIFVPLPKINSFAPVSGPVGTTVNINGENFSPSTTNNIVYFGAVRATVSASSATSISVIVPPGANYQPLSVTTNNMTAYSAQPFNVTYGSGFSFNTNMLNTRVDYASGGTSKRSIAVGDIDNDGWPDMIVGNRDMLQIHLFKNQSTTANISFAPKVDITSPFGPSSVSLGDLNGDGKLDLISGNFFNASISIYKNTSTVGSISFDTRIDLPAGHEPQDVNIVDLDKDGKPDILVANTDDLTVSYYRNSSIAGAISFTPRVSFSALAYHVAVGDLDGDSKPDVIIMSPNDKLLFYRNISEPGNISFALPSEIVTGLHYDPIYIAIGDLDGDGKPDLAVANFTWFAFSTFVNTSTAGNISFATRQDYVTGHNYTKNISLGDVDGDGKIDLALPNDDQNKFSVFRNTSITGAVSFENPVSFGTLVHPNWATINDFNNDSKPDFAIATGDGPNSVCVFKNLATPGNTTLSGFTPAVGATGTAITITGTNFTAATAVSFGGVPAASFTVVNATTITAVVANGASGNVSVSSPGGTATLSGFIFIPAPVITSFTPVNAGSGTTVTITGANFNNATTVSFGSIPVASFTVVNPTTITCVLANGASGSARVITPGGTATLAGFTFIPGPVITSFTPASGVAGTSITIVGSNFTGTTAVNFGGVPASSFTVVNATTIIAVVANGASGNISVTAAGGTATYPGFVFIGPNELVINPNPVRVTAIVKHPVSPKGAYLRLFDFTGKSVKVIVVGQNITQTSFSVKGLASGIYELVWKDDTRELRRTLMISQ